MIDNNCVTMIVNILKSLECDYDIIVNSFKNGDFGDLEDIDFSDGIYVGNISVWSSGMVFYGLIDASKSTDYDIIETTYVDAENITNDVLLNELSKLFDILKNRNNHNIIK